MMGLVAVTMLIMIFLPMLTKKIPAALTAIVVVSLVVIFGELETETVRSFIVANGGEGIKAGLPSFQFPLISLSLETLFFITPYALILAAIGLIESLMTLNLIDELTDSHGSGNRECVAQGAGNLVNGLFGGMGGCAMIGQSIINIKSGGRGRLSGITASPYWYRDARSTHRRKPPKTPRRLSQDLEPPHWPQNRPVACQFAIRQCLRVQSSVSPVWC